MVRGIHGETFGILGVKPYRLDHPKAGEVIGYAQTGLFISHYMVWTAMELARDESLLILEDDALVPVDWQKRFKQALEQVPPDVDILMVGSSNTVDKPKRKVNGCIWEVKYPFCTHAYIVYRKALPVLLDKMRDASMTIDIALIQRVYPSLRVYTVLPRIIDQRDMELTE